MSARLALRFGAADHQQSVGRAILRAAGRRPSRDSPDGDFRSCRAAEFSRRWAKNMSRGRGPFGIAISPSGKIVATANGGPWRYGITILEKGKQRAGTCGNWQRGRPTRSISSAPADWRGVSTGELAYAGEHNLYVAEGNSGKISLIDSGDERRRAIDLNQGGYRDSFTGDLAFDGERNILYAVDQANNRVAVIDAKTRQILTSVKVGRLPFAMTLSPDRQKLYVTNVGLLDYQRDRERRSRRPAGLRAWHFPRSAFRARRRRAAWSGPPRRGAVQSAGGGRSPCAGREFFVRDRCFESRGGESGGVCSGGGSPSGVTATADRRVCFQRRRPIRSAVIDAKSNQLLEAIPIRIPGLEGMRGVLPTGLAYHEKSGWLLVAEAGINAVAVIDVASRRVLGHVPVGWYPTRVAINQDTVFVTCAKGHGQGPSAPVGPRGFVPNQRLLGTISIFPLPAAEELGPQTAFVFQANGLEKRPAHSRRRAFRMASATWC